MKFLPAGIFTLLMLPFTMQAQAPESNSASDILLQMKKLNMLGSVLYIAAHPDDENTRLLAWLSKEKLYKTGYLSLTRGDGGQNLIGDEQGIELGLIRTQELMAARRVDGADQFFSRAYDFGFSKTTAEALSLWNEQKILSDVVWIIRKFQPDVIITRFPEDKRAGHGQHSASSVLARLAYEAAADPKQFPEQLALGVQPWQARRLFLNTFRFGSVNTTSEDQLKIEVGGYNALIGKSYGEIAADSRSQHRSQGFGVPHTRGNFTEYFSLTAGEKTDSALLQNINCSWTRLQNGAAVGLAVDTLISSFDPAGPWKSVPALVEIYKKIKSLPDSRWKHEKLNETAKLIQDCSGLWLEATVPEAYAVRSQTIPVTLRILNRSPVSMKLEKIFVNKQDSSWNQKLEPGVNYTITRPVSLGDLPISQPYWLVEPMSPGSYNVQDQTQIGDPENPPALQATFTVRILDENFLMKVPVYYKYTDAVKGELFEPLTIIPALLATTDPDLLVFTKGTSKELSIRKQVKTTAPDESVQALIHTAGAHASSSAALNGMTLTPVAGFAVNSISASANGRSFVFRSDEGDNKNNSTWVTELVNGTVDTILQCKTISYEHIPRIDYFKPARSTLVSVNLRISGKRIGYIDGAGDRVPEALTAMGYTVVRLTESMVTASVLKTLDAVMTGLRAYDVQDWLQERYSVLMEYVHDGGNLIVQYNRNRGNDSTGIGPYPFGISNSRITEEDAPVKFLVPGHAIFHYPNEITSRDFEGWIQERGIYFANRIDPRYAVLLSMHDKGESDLDGSLLTGVYGKGNFTYTGLVFFRELPAGVPGAYRLLANMIALNQHKPQ